MATKTTKTGSTGGTGRQGTPLNESKRSPGSTTTKTYTPTTGNQTGTPPAPKKK